MKKTKYLLLYFFFLVQISFAQNIERENDIHSYSDRIMDIDDNGDDLWIGTIGGLFKLNKISEQITYYDPETYGLPDQIITVAIDSTQRVWVGSRSYGIGVLENDSCTIYNTQNSNLPIDQWNHVIEVDANNNIWIGCDIWLTKFDGINWTTYTDSAWSICSYCFIYSIFFYSQDIVWFGCSTGLYKIENENMIRFSDIKYQVNTIEKDNNDKIWVGTQWEGIFIFDGNNWSVIDTSNSDIPTNCVFKIKFDSKNNLWFTSDIGIIKYDGTNWELFNKSNSEFPEEYCYAIEIDKNDVIWVGTREHGLYRFDGTTWKNYILSNYTDVKDKDNIPNKFILNQNYPNPFNPSTTIKYSIPRSTEYYSVQQVTLKVYDVLGREVATLVNKEQPPGNYEVEFNANNLTSGLYFYKLQCGSFTATKKLLLLR